MEFDIRADDDYYLGLSLIILFIILTDVNGGHTAGGWVVSWVGISLLNISLKLSVQRRYFSMSRL